MSSQIKKKKNKKYYISAIGIYTFNKKFLNIIFSATFFVKIIIGSFFLDVCTTLARRKKLQARVKDCEKLNDCAIRLLSEDDK